MRNPNGHPFVAALLDPVMRPLEPLRDHVVPLATGRVLEVGVGTGLNLARYDPEQIDHVDGVDPDPHMLARAQPRAEEAPVSVTLHAVGAEALPFPDDHFDTVVCTFVMCTIPALDRALREMARVLRPDGRLLYVEHTVADGWMQWPQRALQPLWGRLAGGCHLARDPLTALREAGFEPDVPTGHGRHALNPAPIWRGTATLRDRSPDPSDSLTPPA